jgi:hypothetical protein
MLFLLGPLGAGAESSSKDIEPRLSQLEERYEQLAQSMESLRKERDQALARADSAETRLNQLRATWKGTQDGTEATTTTAFNLNDSSGEEALGGPVGLPGGERASGLVIGGYGEHHFNFNEGDSGDMSDIHRAVLFLGYQFNDWIKLVTETELEHSFVEEDNGEIALEQFYLDFNFNPAFNVRMGRVLHPAGIINRFHEPTAFYGVERPAFSSLILPSTFSVDGIGIWGRLAEGVDYELYGHAGVQSSGFSANQYMREARQEERPGLDEPGVSGRMDFHPLTLLNIDAPVEWRIGGSGSYIGTGNGNKGDDAGEISGHVLIGAADTDFRWKRFEFRSEFAYLANNIADELANGTSYNAYGWYVQGAVHVLPESWKTGRLKDADVVTFLRYEQVRPQVDVPDPFSANDAFNLNQATVGLSVYPVHNVVLKMDYTFVEALEGDDDNLLNFGFGYDF